MKIEGNKFYVISFGDQKFIEPYRKEAIKILMALVSSSTEDIEELNPEIIEVDVSGEKWNLKGLPWNLIAIELMRNRNSNKEA